MSNIFEVFLIPSIPSINGSNSAFENLNYCPKKEDFKIEYRIIPEKYNLCCSMDKSLSFFSLM